eukprot:8547858-Pyramimonas_sp.AAC.1
MSTASRGPVRSVSKAMDTNDLRLGLLPCEQEAPNRGRAELTASLHRTRAWRARRSAAQRLGPEALGPH